MAIYNILKAHAQPFGFELKMVHLTLASCEIW